MELFKYDIGTQLESINFEILYKKKDYYEEKFCKFTQRNLPWEKAALLPQRFYLELEKLTNASLLVLKDFEYGCELTISLAEYLEGPFINSKKKIIREYITLVYKNKYFCRSKKKLINLSSLPCKYIKIECNKGVHINMDSIYLYGFDPEKAENIFGDEGFKLLVALPSRLMYK